MSRGVLWLVSAAGAGLFMAWVYWYLSFREGRPDEVEDSYGRWRLYSMLLPAAMAALLVFVPGLFSPGERPQLLSFFAQLFVWLSLIFAALLLVMPLLRCVFPPLACAMLWTLPLEGWLLYQILNLNGQNGGLVVCLPPGLPRLLFGASLAGLLLLGAYFIMGHERFRRRLMKNSRTEKDEAVLTVWREECERVKWTNSLHLRRTGALATPLALGMFWFERYVFLPERPYAPEELRLILRHELCHLVRHDPEMKLLFRLCCAFCWWNPLVWLGARRAAEDRELACDEYVVREQSAAERRDYAELLLRQSGPAEGFTSCLSSRAETLRHRMKGVLAARPGRGGAVLIGVGAALIILLGGVLRVGDGRGTVAELVYPELPLSRPAASARLYLSKSGDFFTEQDILEGAEQNSVWYKLPVDGAALLERLAEEELVHLLPQPLFGPAEALPWHVTITWGESGQTLQLTPDSLYSGGEEYRLQSPLTLEEVRAFVE